jgi:hypothetical protein
MIANQSAYTAGLSWFPDYPAGVAPLGNATDDARQARADYFGNLAVAGNVAAARILLGGTLNTSGNEAPMWQAWIDAARLTPLGLQTVQAAQYFGAWWPVGSTDTVDSYPIMKKFVAQWAAANPPPPPIVETPQAVPPPPPPPPLPAPVTPKASAPASSSSVALTTPAPLALAGFSLTQWAMIAGGALALSFVLSSLSPSRR